MDRILKKIKVTLSPFLEGIATILDIWGVSQEPVSLKQIKRKNKKLTKSKTFTDDWDKVRQDSEKISK